MLICQLTDLHLRPEGVAAYRVVETNTLTERAFRAVAALDPRPDLLHPHLPETQPHVMPRRPPRRIRVERILPGHV